MTCKRASFVILFATMTMLAASSVQAVDKPMIAHVGIGASLPQGDLGNLLNDGWALHGGATWFSANRPALGLRLDLGVDWWDISDEFLKQVDTSDALGVQPPDDGDARSWSGTVDLMWNPKSQGTVGWYLVGGVGVYYNAASLSEYGYGTGYWCDPWWGWCYPDVVYGEYLIEEQSSWDWGLNAGVGITFKVSPVSELYLEATYHWIDSERSAELIPVTIGVRW